VEDNVMSEDCNKKTLSWFVLLKIVAVVPVLVAPIGLLVGILLGLIEDFGARNTVANIQANPSMFANQYARIIIFAGWAAVVDFVVMAGIASVMLIRRCGKLPAKNERQSRAAPDQPGG
jgi:hypothetical protein